MDPATLRIIHRPITALTVDHNRNRRRTLIVAHGQEPLGVKTRRAHIHGLFGTRHYADLRRPLNRAIDRTSLIQRGLRRGLLHRDTHGEFHPQPGQLLLTHPQPLPPPPTPAPTPVSPPPPRPPPSPPRHPTQSPAPHRLPDHPTRPPHPRRPPRRHACLKRQPNGHQPRDLVDLHRHKPGQITGIIPGSKTAL